MEYLSVIMGLLLAWPTIVLAEPTALQLEMLEDSLEEEARETLWHFQAGVFYRLGGNRFFPSESSSMMASADISCLKFDRTRSAWGLGIHGTFCDKPGGGLRLGPRALYRIPLSKPTGSFLQASTGLYLVGYNNSLRDTQHEAILNFPGYFLETEYGINNNYSVVLGAEVLPTNIFENESATPTDNQITTNYWGGVRVGQESMIIPLLVVGILVGIAIVGIANSGIAT